jgi:RecQ family ATP-dependent DNA helicase
MKKKDEARKMSLLGNNLKNNMKERSLELLEKYFGFSDFRKGQWEVVEHILRGKNAIAVFPTGGGKSLCYQLPALMMPGTTIVISPLISLMKDQVDALLDKGIAASFISSSISDHEVQRRLQEMKRGMYKIVYIAPERFQSEAFTEALKDIHIPFLAVDEAHCISQWGHNFRPSYLRIKDFIRSVGNPVVAAFTATANEKVQKDMITLLGLTECRLFVGSFDRPNLEFRIEDPDSPDAFVLNYARRHPDWLGIVYASTRRNVENLFYYLTNNGIRAGMYHAGLTAEQRNRQQDSFLSEGIQVMAATNAFGMGIDKSNVRFIIHYNMPISMESYYQEAGRAGRDGKKAVCILIRNPEDYQLNKFLISSNYPPVKAAENLFHRIGRRRKTGIPVEKLLNRRSPGASVRDSALKKIIEYGYAEIRSGLVFPTEKKHFTLSQKEIDRHKHIELEKLDTMQRYTDEKVCLRAYILRYFNEEPPEERCGNCSLCYQSAVEDDKGMMDMLLSQIMGRK